MTRALLALLLVLATAAPAYAEMNFSRNAKKQEPEKKVEEEQKTESLKAATEDAMKEAIVEAKNEQASGAPTEPVLADVPEEPVPAAVTMPPALAAPPPPVPAEEAKPKKKGFWGAEGKKVVKEEPKAKNVQKAAAKKTERPDF